MKRDDRITDRHERQVPFVLRLVSGVVVAASLAGVSAVVSIETQVEMLRWYANDGGSSLEHYDPGLWVTWPRRLYRKLPAQLGLAIVIGSLAGLAYAPSRIRKALAVVLLSIIPAGYAALACYRYNHEYKPNVKSDLEYSFKIQRFRETGIWGD